MPDEEAESPLYQCSPSFNTEELDSALGVGSSTGTELSEISLMGEITWREGAGEPTSTRTFLVVVENDVNRGTEGVPTSAEPPYPAPGSIVLRSDEGYDVTLRNTLKTFNANTASIDQITDIIATLIDTLKSKNLI